MKVLLVEPEYKYTNRTKHEAKLCPIGLYKHYFYHIQKGDTAIIVKGCKPVEITPDLIKITTLFTYWSDDIYRTIDYYRTIYPNVTIQVGGIFASLMPKRIKKDKPFVMIHKGIDFQVENTQVNWRELHKNIQILHASRSCFRDCSFCGVKTIEPEISFKSWDELKSEIQLNDIVFFDNNFLMSPYHEEILKGLAGYKVNNKIIRCEMQSGFDSRLMTYEDAKMLKNAHFKNIRISWDHGLEQMETVRTALKNLECAGYTAKNIGVFMLYNWEYPFELLEIKRKICLEWNVQIYDCRFRPLDQLYDNYNPYAKHQTNKDYYIHLCWTDEQIRQFRRNIRRQNIMIRFNFKSEEQLDNWIKKKRKTGKLFKRKLNLNQKRLIDF